MLDVEWAENVELDVMLQWLEHTPGPLAQTQTGGWRLAAAGAMGNIIYPARAPHTQSGSGAWKECRLRGDEDPSSWQGYNHPGGLCFIIHACIILLCCYVVSGNLAFCRHYNPTITRSRPVANRASNEDSRRFHNHRECLLCWKCLISHSRHWNQAACQLWSLRQCPNFTSTYRIV